MRRNYFWLLLLFLWPLACAESVETEGDDAAAFPDLPPGDSALVVDVIDGDTADMEINGEVYRVRYIGVDTPERGDFYYQEAADANANLVLNQEVILVLDVSETDQFGRLLRYVYLTDGTFVNAELVRQGYARRSTFPPDVAHAAYFGELEQEARESGAGLWADPAPCTCSKNNYNCADFTTQTDAQACFDYCLAEVDEDVHSLDGGGDGVVCESLPE